MFTPFAVNWFAGYEIVYAIFAFMLIGDTNYLLHLHIHRPFSRKPALNLLFDLSMGATTGMTASNWRMQHLYGHHRGIEGICLDVEGNIVAVGGWHRSGPGPLVHVFAPGGALMETHQIPADLPNKCCFGGPDLDTLYVTTAGGQLYRAPAKGRHGSK